MAKSVVSIRPQRSVGLQRPLVLGILNVTPDSFSDGGRWEDAAAAIAQGELMAKQGADLIDVGGESTRPGAERVPARDEQRRVLPVVEALVDRGIRVSIDTMNSSTARAAARAGAEYVNDVSGGLADPEMFRVVAETGVKYIAMHWRGHSDTMQDNAHYDDVVSEVRQELKDRIAELLVWGVDPENIVIDPGLGFAKTAEHNWKLLAALPRLNTIGYPILIGASRKRFLAGLVEDSATPEARDAPTALISAMAAQAGVWGVRVHDIPSTMRALDVWSAWNAGAERG
jgi:dihydropteroate synthase